MKGKKTGGRVKGSINESTKQMRTVKETVLSVFQDLQNDPKANLMEFAKNNTKDFYQIAAKLIPTEVKANVEVITPNLPEWMNDESESELSTHKE